MYTHADGGIHATRDHNNIRSALQTTKKKAQDHSDGEMLLHENTRPHTAARTQALQLGVV
jgi:hypothetical protein